MTYPIVQVHWIDSFTRNGWQQVEDSMETDVTCQSIGYLVAESNDAITIASSIETHGSCADPLTIPRVAITGFWELEIE